MKKLLTTLLAVALTSCTLFVDKVTDVSQEPGYRDVIGKLFKLKSSVFLYTAQGQKEIYLEEPGTSTMPDLKDIPKEFPYDYHNTKILGVLDAGATFQVEKTIYTKSFEHSYVRYKAFITSSGAFQGTEVDPTWLAEVVTYPKVPKFDPKYVEEMPFPSDKISKKL